MAIRPVLRMGHPVLQQVAAPVGHFGTRELQELVRDMDDTMRSLNGAGIAAPQIGVSLRVVIFEVKHNPRYPDAGEVPYTVLVNPQLTPLGDELEDGWVGCLSVPGIFAGGDAVRGADLVVTAVAEGRDAAGSIATLLLAWRTGENHLYLSAALTLALKVILLPWLLHRLIRRLDVYWDTEPMINAPSTMLIGLLVVIFAFGLAQPISALASTATRSTIGIAIAVILLSFLTMITRRKAMSQVVGFLSMENGLFFGAMSTTYGMPMVVELGVALDVLVAMLVLGVFFFQIREQFDSLDLHHLESLREDE